MNGSCRGPPPLGCTSYTAWLGPPQPPATACPPPSPGLQDTPRQPPSTLPPHAARDTHRRPMEGGGSSKGSAAWGSPRDAWEKPKTPCVDAARQS